MKSIDRSAFHLIPATALTVICFTGLTNALTPVTWSGISEASNLTAYLGHLILVTIALASGMGLIFRIRAAYPVSIVATTLLLGAASFQLFGLFERAPKMEQIVFSSLLVGNIVYVFVLISILLMLSLAPTRERCFPRRRES
ncbi:MAG: hypothetical protein P1U86_08445 [Verrucomicrobiales bacterium]|nr:hypothetical protein [Verrucomicrobiales bacterium]